MRKGQTTAFIILALVIAVLAVLLFFFYPKMSSVFGLDAEPNSFMSSCIEPEVVAGMELLSKQGGYANPEGYILYKGEMVKYLCYTSQYYLPCLVQQPLLVAKFERELGEMIKAKAISCADELENYYESRGYEISRGEDVKVDVSIVPDRLSVVVEAGMTMTKDTTQNYKYFKFNKATKLYSLLMTALSIIDFESTYGDSETTLYMQYYPDLQIQKTKLIDGSTVYTVRDVTSDESFTFASRSLAWPPGYGATA
ncbi:MAG: hypothetical protein KJ600_01590 [Nanoarchaeota archaeon]|nr:hypothetical protein [Nanoarchaeota archaeon]MBU1103232.1 hypothetical protein [Nanoarchaeota archaeon]